MNSKQIPAALLLAFAVPSAFAVEQELVPWNANWSYFHPMSDDPGLDDAAIDNTGAGVSPNTGPDLIHTGFNAGTGAWFAAQSVFSGPGGYAAVFGKGFGLDGLLIGDPFGNYSTYDGGSGPGPFGYGAIDYFGIGGAELLAFGTTLTLTPDNRKWGAYFRTTFTTLQEYTKPRVRLLLDDNALIYIDGVLVARVNRSNDNSTYNDTGNSDTTATNNETFVSANNEAAIQSFPLDVAGGPAATADSFVVTALPKLTAGEHTIAVLVRNSGGNSSDMAFGMQLLADDAGISASVSNVTRTDAGTPLDVSDDTYSFVVEVSAINLPGALGWTSDNLPANGPIAGVYEPTALVYTYTFPAQASNSSPVNTNTITFTDSLNPAISTQVVVTSPEAPNGPPLVLAPATPMVRAGFEEPPLTTRNHNRKVYHTELGFTSTSGSGPDSPGGTTQQGGVYQDAIIGEINKTWRAVNGVCTLTTEAIGLDPSVTGLKVSMRVRAYTTSGTSFETIDAISLGVETSPDGVAWTPQGNVLPVLNGSPDATGQQNLDRIINLIGPDASSVNDGVYVTLTREAIPVGAGAAFVRLRYTNAADLSTSENVLLDDLQIEIGTVNPAGDPDGDLATNFEEEEWGSDPNSAFSRPGILNHAISPGLNPGETTLTAEIYSGNPFHSYTFRVSDDLVTWTETTVQGIDDAFVFADTTFSTHRFLQVRSNY